MELAGVLIHTTARRFARMRQFYVDILGLSPRNDRRGFVNFAWGDQRLTIAVHSELSAGAADPLRVMVNLRTDDIERDHSRLEGAGVEFVRVPERESWGGRLATLKDPDGNLLQLLEIPGE